jgi:CubicO group peptidase (beta-lactamase class C family)
MRSPLPPIPALPSRPRRAFLLSSAAALAAGGLSACGGDDDSEREPVLTESPELQRVADEAVRADLVGVVVGRLTPEVRSRQAAGLRRIGAAERVRGDDPFLIGSTTKAMTSMVAARLVERGMLSWTSTLAEALPVLAPAMRADYRGVTLEQLLAHRGGLMAFTDPADVAQFESYLSNDAAEAPATLAARQRLFAQWLLAQPSPEGVVPGRDFFYSNAGYALAAMVLEARAGRPYAALVEQELVQPLGVPLRWLPSDEVAKDRPAGHAGQAAQLAALPPDDGPRARWAEVLRPAGVDTAATPDAYARWLHWHLLALRGKPTPLPEGYLRRLRSLAEGDYGLGWVALKLDGRPVLVHDGAYAGFCSLAVVDTAGRSASFAFTNTGVEEGDWPLQRLNDAVLAIEQRWPAAG